MDKRIAIDRHSAWLVPWYNYVSKRVPHQLLRLTHLPLVSTEWSKNKAEKLVNEYVVTLRQKLLQRWVETITSVMCRNYAAQNCCIRL